MAKDKKMGNDDLLSQETIDELLSPLEEIKDVLLNQ